MPADGTFLIAHPAYKDSYGANLDHSSASYYLTENTVVLLYDQSGTLLDRKVSGTACDAPPPEPEPIPQTPDPVPSPDPTPLPVPITVRFNEIFSNPVGNESEGEFIELINTGSNTTDIGGCTIHDASKTGSYTFPKDTTIKTGEYFVLTRNVSKISLNNGSETLSFFDSKNTLIDFLRFEKTKEGISLNYAPDRFRGGAPTPGLANDLNTLPKTSERVPKKGYRGVAVSFRARGTDADGDNLEYVWNFGDGHKSYKDKTTHTYEENGTYEVTLTTTDGSDDVTETFPLKIESLPKPDVRITRMIPNPIGKDTEGEWIMIENRGKKSIDLKGFGIATGWKKLANHPIRESFVIKPKETAKLTRERSLFTLPNQKGKIELRAPDGKVLQKIQYKLSTSVEEGIVYDKQKGKRWEWQEDDETKSIQTKLPLTETIPEETITTPIELPLTPTEAPKDTPGEESPKEDNVAPPENPDITGEKQVLGAETVLSEIPPGDVLPVPPLSTGKYPFIAFFRNFFTNLNARLNDWQMNSRKAQKPCDFSCSEDYSRVIATISDCVPILMVGPQVPTPLVVERLKFPMV